MGSKNKKRIVLPMRPDPPAVEEIIDDINRADLKDPAFRLQLNIHEGSHGSELETRYMQSRRYLELNERLQEARSDLIQKRDMLRMVGESLQKSVTEVKSKSV